MFKELTKYEENNKFFLRQNDKLRDVCNAPTNKSGVYIVYSIKGEEKELIYIGCSGKIQVDGSIFIRKAGLGGIKDRIVNGHQFGKVPRRTSWLAKISEYKFDALEINWYSTHNSSYNDCPRILENKLLNNHLNIYGHLPKWNNKL